MNDAGPLLLSVLIPVWNGERYLAETIESVLQQQWQPIEIVVVDDGSEDGSAEVAAGFGDAVRCVRRPHRGLSAARNTALAAARGGFIAHLDADDLLPPGSIAVRMAAFTADPALEIVVGHQREFFSPDLAEADRSRLALPASAKPGHVAGTSIVRAECFRRLGGFDEQLRAFADLDWFIRAQETGARLRLLPDVVMHRRVHGRNMTLTHKEAAGDRMKVLKASLDRRRRAAEGGAA